MSDTATPISTEHEDTICVQGGYQDRKSVV